MFTSAMQLKDWMKNKSKQTGTHANILLQNYMLERFLERVSVSAYRQNLILKGGFLIAAMVGVDKRSTMDMDTTVKGLPVSREGIERILREITAIDADDGVSFEIQDIKNIHYRLMFEDRTIPVMAYNLNTILAEKIETILVRGVGNTRGRDYYDAYLLLSINKGTLSKPELLHALRVKAEERGSAPALEGHRKILGDIAASPDIAKIWDGYARRYPYAKGIALQDILALIAWVFEEEMGLYV